MKMYTKQELNAYLQDDWIERLLRESYNDEEKGKKFEQIVG